MSKGKSPFGRFSEEEVMQAELNTYIIQIGHELFAEGDFYAFSKERVEYFYDQIMAGMRDLIENGTQTEKDDAIRALWNFRVIPLRIQ